jgi:hypothetical protein
MPGAATAIWYPSGVMDAGPLTLAVVAFGVALWLGGYLLAGHGEKRLARLTGLGLVAYALAVAGEALSQVAPAALAMPIARVHWLILFLPALLWSGVLVHLLPEESGLHARLTRAWRLGLLPLTVAGLLVGAGAELVVANVAGVPRVGPAYPLLAALVLAPLGLGLVLVARRVAAIRPRPAAGLILVTSLFFALGAGLLLTPLAWLPRGWLLLSLGVDLLLLGLAIAAVNAFDEGESLVPDLTRSLVGAASAALVFGLLVALGMVASGGVTLPLLAQLLATLNPEICSHV